METKKNSPAQEPQLRSERSEDFASAYANNVYFEPSVWDLKLIFGELDGASNTNQQHTAVTMSWVVAKLLAHHLNVQIATHEIAQEKIVIPRDVWPAEIAPPPEQFVDDPKFQKLYKTMIAFRDEFIAKNS